MRRPARIGFLNDNPLVRVGDALHTDDPFYRFLLGFGAHFDELVFLARVFGHEGGDPPPYRVDAPKIRVAALPPYPRIDALYRRPWRWWPAIETVLRRELPRLDALWLNVGHPVSLRALLIANRHPALRCFGAMRGAYERDAELRAGGTWLRGRVAGRLMAANVDLFARLARRSEVPCFAYGRAVARRLEQRGVEVLPLMDSLLTEAEVARLPRSRPELRADLLFVGRLTPEKGLDVLLRALGGQSGPGGAPATLRVVGDGPEATSLQALARSLGLAERVHFDGHVPFGPRLFARYASCHVLALPSRTEGVPKAACEAMAFGRPVVASSLGGLPELIGEDEARGWLVPPEDPAALGRALKEALGDAKARKARGRAARRHAKGFTRERLVREVVARVMPERLSVPAAEPGAPR